MNNGLVMINGLWMSRPFFYESKLEYVDRVKAQCTCGNSAHESNCPITLTGRAWSEDLDRQYAAWKNRPPVVKNGQEDHP